MIQKERETKYFIKKDFIKKVKNMLCYMFMLDLKFLKCKKDAIETFDVQ